MRFYNNSRPISQTEYLKLQAENKLNKDTIYFVEDFTSQFTDLLDDFMKYFDPDSEYGTGYLDCLFDVCEKLSIPAKRLESSIEINAKG